MLVSEVKIIKLHLLLIAGEFHCLNDRCVQNTGANKRTCDQINDCGDSSDELLNECAKTTVIR